MGEDIFLVTSLAEKNAFDLYLSAFTIDYPLYKKEIIEYGKKRGDRSFV